MDYTDFTDRTHPCHPCHQWSKKFLSASQILLSCCRELMALPRLRDRCFASQVSRTRLCRADCRAATSGVGRGGKDGDCVFRLPVAQGAENAAEVCGEVWGGEVTTETRSGGEFLSRGCTRISTDIATSVSEWMFNHEHTKDTKSFLHRGRRDFLTANERELTRILLHKIFQMNGAERKIS